MWAELYSVLSQITHLTDRWTDSFLVACPRWHFMQRGKNNSLSQVAVWQRSMLNYWITRRPQCLSFAWHMHSCAAAWLTYQ